MKITEHLLGPQGRGKLSMIGHKLMSRVFRDDIFSYTISFFPLVSMPVADH